jgi:diguanylate cyclase (GGDEF)-like protein
MVQDDGGAVTRGGAVLRHDRRRAQAWFAAAGAMSVFCLLLQALRPGTLHVAWVPGGIAMALGAWTARRAARFGDLPPAGRRFWNQIAVAAAVVTPGACLLNLINTQVIRTTIPLIVAAVAPIGTALLLVIWALLRLPAARRGHGEALRLGLDAATVMVVAATVLWEFQVRPMIGSDPRLSTVIGPLVLCVICLGAVLAVVKLVLAGTDAVPSRGLHSLALVVLIGALSSAVTKLLENDPRGRGAGPLISTLEGGLVAWAALRSYQASKSAADDRRGGGFSMLPYAAVAAIDILLITVTVAGKPSLAVVAGSVLVTLIVVGRQVLAFRDNARLIGSLHEHRQLLHHQATHDPLTGLANRALFDERLALVCAEPGLPRSALLMVDLDGFKQVNDTLGHAAGDDLLVEIGRRLGASVRDVDLVARLGGDEFAILLPGSTAADAGHVAERIMDALRAPIQTHGTALTARASIGVATHADGDDAGRLIRRADLAMYEAKTAGKNRYAAPPPELSVATTGPPGFR